MEGCLLVMKSRVVPRDSSLASAKASQLSRKFWSAEMEGDQLEFPVCSNESEIGRLTKLLSSEARGKGPSTRKGGKPWRKPLGSPCRRPRFSFV